MTSLLVGLADAAHIPLHYGWVGTRDISFQPSEMPIPFAFNHMIGIYIDGGDTLVLDATGKQAYMGEVSSQLYNKEVLITLDENRFALYKIPTPEPEKNKLEVNARYYLSETESEWKANYSAQLEGQKKIAFNYLNKLPTSSFDKKAKPNAVFSETENSVAVAYQIEENNSQKARVSWQQPLENGVVQLTDSWLINPYPNKYKSLSAIDTDERDSPILIDFPFEEKNDVFDQHPRRVRTGQHRARYRLYRRGGQHPLPNPPKRPNAGNRVFAHGTAPAHLPGRFHPIQPF